MRDALRKTISAICLTATLSCGAAPTVIAEGPQIADAPSVLIAVRPSDFKQTLVDRLFSNYNDTVRMTRIDIEDLADANLDGYDAVVVMGARMGFLLFSGEERRFLKSMKHPEKTVMVMTAAVQDWQWERDDIDVITGASKPEYADFFVARLTERLDEILHNR